MSSLLNASARRRKTTCTRPLATKSDCQLRAPRETLTATAVPPSRPQCRLVTRCREDCDWSGLSLSLSPSRARARTCICVASDTIVGSFTRTRIGLREERRGEGGGWKRGQFTPGLYSQFMRQAPSYPLPTLTTTTNTHTSTILRQIVSLSPPDTSRRPHRSVYFPLHIAGCRRIVSLVLNWRD